MDLALRQNSKNAVIVLHKVYDLLAKTIYDYTEWKDAYAVFRQRSYEELCDQVIAFSQQIRGQ